MHLPAPTPSNTGQREKQFSPSWHVLPVHWGGQIHLNPSTRSWQVPPWPQGFGEQSSISVMQIKERLTSVTEQAMSVTHKFDKWLLLLGFDLRKRQTTGLLLGISRSTLISAKAPLKNNSSVKWSSKHREEVYTRGLFASRSQILIQQVSLNSILNNLLECYKNSAFCFFQENIAHSFPWHLTKTLVQEAKEKRVHSVINGCQEPMLKLGKVK